MTLTEEINEAIESLDGADERQKESIFRTLTILRDRQEREGEKG